MANPPSESVTRLLAAVGCGDAAAHDKLWALVYDELHRVAQHQMVEEAPGRTFQTTVLIHEAYLRLVGDQNVQWTSRRHFFAAAANAMRRIRIDDARKRNRLKRGGGQQPGPLDEESVPHSQRGQGTPAPAFDEDPAEVLAINEALDRLQQVDPRKAEVVMLRYFAGLTIDETAEAMELSPRTVDNDWRFARAWLRRELTVVENASRGTGRQP